MATKTITVEASRYEDADDCLAAAAADYVSTHPQAAGWDLSPHWEDERNRERIVLVIPGFIAAAGTRDRNGIALDDNDNVTGISCRLNHAGDSNISPAAGNTYSCNNCGCFYSITEVREMVASAAEARRQGAV